MKKTEKYQKNEKHHFFASSVIDNYKRPFFGQVTQDRQLRQVRQERQERQLVESNLLSLQFHLYVLSVCLFHLEGGQKIFNSTESLKIIFVNFTFLFFIISTLKNISKVQSLFLNVITDNVIIKFIGSG
jgi:hypothetical protein